MLAELFEAIVKAGLPVGVLSYAMLHWAFHSGYLYADDDIKGLKSQMKTLRKESKRQRIKTKNPLHNQWMRFGGGFYGMVALATFIIIEGQDLIKFFTQFDTFAGFWDALGFGLLVDMFVQGIKNFFAGLLWPLYWLNNLDSGRLWVWFIAAYAGYGIGMRLAQARGRTVVGE